MDKNKIIKKVIEKLSNFNQRHFKNLPRLVTHIKKNPSNRLPIILNNYRNTFKLSDQEYSLILESRIERYQVHLISKEHKDELKKITNSRPISIYFDLLY